MHIRVGCEFHYDATNPTPTVWQVRPRADGPHRVLDESWQIPQEGLPTSYLDAYGNTCDRLILPQGPSSVRYGALVEVPPTYDEADKGAVQLPLEAVPDEALVYLLPSRMCWSDVLRNDAWQLFGATEPGWPRVQAVCDWVHGNISFGYGSSTAVTTAVDVFERRIGVCRDFAHLALTFCRGLNIPARYVCGYLPDIAVPVNDAPMDFCAWIEVYLEDRWWTFDPRNNASRIGRIVIGRGRDAVDVAMVTAYGEVVLRDMSVWADEVATYAGD